ncbi:division/cell wall cluster transcriptional repressor MraZ [Oceaniglobus roseus]|uniref:division/cell wall cluster transcriptional repressor MraZ n=1 Tax=Oceaniglobus roseus TaxID=1737570 RepID=UPI000C7E880B|nr:division/cell wall cluster transcriptional repressor MraZ [Kandeliimicrobium roseum]
MLEVFIGEHDNKIDTKGRMSVPADFRRVLEEGDPKWEPGKNASMAIVHGTEARNYLEVFTMTSFERVHKKISKLPPASKQRRALEILYAAKTVTATLDETGRIVLPARLRDKLNLQGAVKIVGSGQTFKIWEPAVYEAENAMQLMEDEDFDPNVDASVYLPGDED